jgi:multidrug efflux system outer membrane protein
VLAEQMALLLLDGQRLEQGIALTKALGGGYTSDTAKP